MENGEGGFAVDGQTDVLPQRQIGIGRRSSSDGIVTRLPPHPINEDGLATLGEEQQSKVLGRARSRKHLISVLNSMVEGVRPIEGLGFVQPFFQLRGVVTSGGLLIKRRRTWNT
jgi:hypothetical protein